MRVFVTGATGFIGSAIVRELMRAGHQVLGLARSEASAQSLAATGAAVHRGSLEDLESLRQGAKVTDGIIHTGFIHDFANFEASCELDRHVIAAMASELAGSARPFLISSGTALLAPGRVGLEEHDHPHGPDSFPRVATERAAVAASTRGARVAIVRLPPCVHGPGDRGFLPAFIDIARKQGVSAYVDDGVNRWPSVHQRDVAVLCRLILEKAPPAALRFHAVAEEAIPFRSIATVIGQRLGLPVVSKPLGEASAHFGWFSHFAALDCPASGERTQEDLDWHPRELDLLADLASTSYFGI